MLHLGISSLNTGHKLVYCTDFAGWNPDSPYSWHSGGQASVKAQVV